MKLQHPKTMTKYNYVVEDFARKIAENEKMLLSSDDPTVLRLDAPRKIPLVTTATFLPELW